MYYTCPHCFKSISTGNFLYYCFQHNDYFKFPHYDWEKDFWQNEFTFANLKLFIFPKYADQLNELKAKYANKYKRAIYCPDCGATNQAKRLCPHCKEEFYYKLLGEQTNIVSIVGPANSGKTVFIGVLINELRNDIFLREKDYSFEFVGQRTTDVYRDFFYEPLYEDKVLPNKNNTLSTGNFEQSARKPMIFHVKKVGSKNNIILSFYDSPGEDIEDLDAARTHLKNMYASQGLILLMDLTDKETLMTSMQTLDNVVQMLREGKALYANDKIPTRLALVFTKCDRYKKELGSICSNPPKIPTIEYIDLVSSTFENYLKVNGYKHILNTTQNNFSNYRYLPVSALGWEPKAAPDISKNEIAPMMIEYPIAWLINELG